MAELISPTTIAKWKHFRRLWRRALKDEDWFNARAHAGDFLIYCEKHGWPDWWSEAERVISDCELARQRQTPDRIFG